MIRVARPHLAVQAGSRPDLGSPQNCRAHDLGSLFGGIRASNAPFRLISLERPQIVSVAANVSLSLSRPVCAYVSGYFLGHLRQLPQSAPFGAFSAPPKGYGDAIWCSQSNGRAANDAEAGQRTSSVYCRESKICWKFALSFAIAINYVGTAPT